LCARHHISIWLMIIQQFNMESTPDYFSLPASKNY
jgi:hypothetical protein